MADEGWLQDINNQVVKIMLVSIDPVKQTATLNVRLRGDKRWHFYENLTVELRGAIVIHDGLSEDHAGNAGGKASSVPRVTFDTLLEDTGVSHV